ncbi:hypothetical protein evm_006700 [Chilo suppressalis]|nr:hypothetical protein evm_006700 [Chilo suppressalis]
MSRTGYAKRLGSLSQGEILTNIRASFKNISRFFALAVGTPALLLKKKLLGLKKPSADVFLSHLETERGLMVNYWTSAEGQQAIKASIQNSQ